MPEITTRTIGEMKVVARKPDEVGMPGSAPAYWVVRDPGRNITIIPPDWLGGGEYPKTYGHLHEPPYQETYRVAAGKGGLLYQKMVGNEVAEIHLKILNEGESFTIPADFTGHVLINLGDGNLVAIDDDNPANSRHVYEPVSQKKGFGYYLIEGVVEIPNPNFANLPPLQKDA